MRNHMPAILRPEDYDRWLGDEEPPADLLAPFPAEPMTMWPISARVNSPQNDDPALLTALSWRATERQPRCEGVKRR